MGILFQYQFSLLCPVSGLLSAFDVHVLQLQKVGASLERSHYCPGMLATDTLVQS